MTKLKLKRRRMQRLAQRRANLAAAQAAPLAACLQNQQEPWASRVAPEDKPRAIASIERFDNFARLRNALREISGRRDEWAGIPIPLEGKRFVVEPTWPAAEIFKAKDEPEDPEDDKYRNARIINQWYDARWRCDIIIFENEGKRDWGKAPAFHHLGHDLETLDCSVVWGIEQEHNAVTTLGTMLRHHKLKQYLLTGMFMETSQRSGIHYLFRRLKPTVAISTRSGSGRILAALCLHPIGYYAGSWAGAMCPTDDVIAHLSLMRGDEPMFWRRANHHPPYRPEAGL